MNSSIFIVLTLISLIVTRVNFAGPLANECRLSDHWSRGHILSRRSPRLLSIKQTDMRLVLKVTLGLKLWCNWH